MYDAGAGTPLELFCSHVGFLCEDVCLLSVLRHTYQFMAVTCVYWAIRFAVADDSSELLLALNNHLCKIF